MRKGWPKEWFRLFVIRPRKQIAHSGTDMAFGALPPGQPGNWDIFDKDGNFDTFFSCSIKSENKISSNPVEKGSFADYNKVASPTAVSVVLGRTGKSDELAAFLTTLDKLVDSTDLVSIVTPEKTFLDYNLVSYDYDRKAENGVDRLIVGLMLQEIRQVEAQYSNESIKKISKAQAKNPTDASTTDAGKQQGQKVGPSTAARIKKGAQKWLRGGSE